MHARTQYAHMVGAICLDKGQNADGQPAPVTFTVKEVVNGHHVWQQGTIAHSRDLDTLQQAIERLHCLFGLEMEERGYTYCERGSQNPFTIGDNDDMYDPFKGESGWYTEFDSTSDFACDYPTEDYPLLASEWVKRGIHSYAYDNYTVCIVTSAGNVVH